MKQSMYATALVTTCAALTATLAWSLGGAPLESVFGPTGVGAIVIGVVGALLATFTGCASLPSNAKFAYWQGKLEAEKLRYDKESLKINEKATRIQELLKKIQAEGTKTTAGGYIPLPSDEAQMAKWAAEIMKIEANRQQEKDAQDKAAKALSDTANDAVNEASKVLEKANNTIGQSNIAPAGAGSGSHYVMGWDRFRDGLRTRLQKAENEIHENLEKTALLAQFDEETEPGMAELTTSLEGISYDVSLRELARLLQIIDLYAQRQVERLHVDYGGSWDHAGELIGYMLRQNGPTVVLAPAEDESEIEMVARIVLNRRTVGRIDTGDLLVIDLPEGIALGEPLELNPSDGVIVKACGNEAGSRSVAIHVTEAPEMGGRRIVVGFNQRLRVSRDGPAVGEARVWNMATDVGTRLTIGKLPPC